MKMEFTKANTETIYHLTEEESEVVGSELSKIQRKQSIITPAAVVQSAAPANSKLHGYFEWNDGKAGIKWRENQARQLIGSVFVVNRDRPDQPPIRAFVNVRPERDDGLIAERGYVSIQTLKNHVSYEEQVVQYARDQLESWSRRFGHLEEFYSVTQEIKKTLKK